MQFNERIFYLLEAYTSGTASTGEEQELMTWMADAEEDSELKEYVRKFWSNYKPDNVYDKIDWDSMFNKIIVGNKGPSLSLKASFHWRWWTRAAAAAVIILVGMFYWLFSTIGSKQHKNFVVKSPNEIKSPAINKAMITLANGQKIYLDSANNGTIVTQGSMQLIKLSDGHIAYEKKRGDGALSGTNGYNTLSNPKGSKVIDMQLADGTRVWLNAGSSIVYPVVFSDKKKVSITGEAYFEVAKEYNRPFLVSAGDMEVRVLGTKFNINVYSDEAIPRATLVEGAVSVKANSTTVLLKPGEGVHLDKDGGLHLQKHVNVEQVLSWKNGYFSFKDADLSSILLQASRWYDVDVIFEGDMPIVRFSGDIDRGLTLNQFLSILDETRIHYRIEGKKLIIIP
ncbi:FecR domain-containing protein [Chitinophaga sp. 212800010-3]|uniref:FecR family protein n=1 Tax=unclassified Chitinophaga TaxID=2619133 RepID=UPI002DEB33F2|nr:hypothetical protein [Chitinophaga sp. 212800010-3]